ncbi:MAG: hemagglutinin repeat-containing protein [Gammaproteobacteria bacterium]|nr:hemagglutinin repeat-containing protein [Gammaproteobacteria bacterium]
MSLIETHERFASKTPFLGSDYMMKAISPETDQLNKRLGDAFYEAQLVADQIQDVSGNQYLGSFANKGDQYQWLMDNAIAASKTLNIAAGVSLSTEYLQQLTQPIVWPVNKDVTLADGSVQNVTVPVVYLPALSYDNLKDDGAIIVGNTLDLGSRGDINNLGGTIQGRQQLNLQSGGDINNVAGTLGGGNVSIDAAGNIQNLATTRKFNFSNAAGSIDQTVLTGQGTIQATGNLIVNAGGDFIDQAGKLLAGGNASITAQGNLTQLDLELGNTLASANTNASGNRTATSTLITGGDANLSAEGALTSMGATLQSGGKLSLKGATVDLQTTESRQQSNTELDGGLIQYANSQSSTDQTGVNASAAAGISIEATEGDVNIVGGDLQSASNIAIKAKGDVNLIEARDSDQSESRVEEEGGLFSGDSASSQSSDKNLADVSNLTAGGGINIEAGGDVLSQGTQIDANIGTNIDAEGNVTLTSAKDYISTRSSEESSSWGSLISEESSSTSDSTQHTATVINSQTLAISRQTVSLEGT